MNILIIAATSFEITPFKNWLVAHFPMNNFEEFEWDKGNIKLLVAGVGMLSTAYQLTKELCFHKPDLVIQAGIGGVFPEYFNGAIGDVFNVISDFNADLGVQTLQGDFIPLSALPFAKDVCTQWGNPLMDKQNGAHFLYEKMLQLPKAKGITVNTGSKILNIPNEVASLNNLNLPVIESMEGAALHAICNAEHIDFLQIRAISNYVEPRNPANWQIPLAIENLNSQLKSLFK